LNRKGVDPLDRRLSWHSLALFASSPCWLEPEGGHIEPKNIIAGPNPTVTEAPYLRICHNTMDNQAMATKATETTIRLKRRIRFSYSCA
jgi:hypothetical protein